MFLSSSSGELRICSDAFVRHLKRCDRAGDMEQMIRNLRPTKQTRDKRACDRCAQMKMKCSSEKPCENCARRSVPCEYTREGYIDPFADCVVAPGPKYNEAKDDIEQPPALLSSFSESYFASPVSQSTQNFQVHSAGWSDTPWMESILLQNDTGHSVVNTLSGPQEDECTLGQPEDGLGNLNLDLALNGFPLGESGTFPFAALTDSTWDSLALDSGQRGGPAIRPCITEYAATEATGLTLPRLSSTKKDGFSMMELDPVEAKAADIRNLLQGQDSLLSQEVIARYITRENVLTCCELYGKNFQRNLPLLHTPTFKLTEASPLLALSLTLAGACYSPAVIPYSCITKFAMRLLLVVQNQTVRTHSSEWWFVVV